MSLSADQAFAALEATWPAAEVEATGPWLIRTGLGGGKRVSAASVMGAFDVSDLEQAEAAMQALGQPHLFALRPGDEALDKALAARGYGIVDPTLIHAIEVGELTTEPLPRVAAFQIWRPLAIINDIWVQGGIGPARQAVMQRANGAKTAILARHSDQPAGAAFVAIHENVAMIHAIEVVGDLRRQGVGRNILRAAAFWAQDHGATHLALAVTRANAGANALYASVGFTLVGHYHYRIKDVAQQTRSSND